MRQWSFGVGLALGALLGCGSDAPATMDTGLPSDTGASDGNAVTPDGAATDGSDTGTTDTSTPMDGALDGAQDTGLDGGGPDGVVSDGAVLDGEPMDGGAGDGASGDGTAGDAPPGDARDGGSPGFALRPYRGGALVGAGGVMLSSRFRMVSTLGQSTVHVGTMRSAGFRLQGGLVGATGDRR
jgi:hypothetical protein